MSNSQLKPKCSHGRVEPCPDCNGVRCQLCKEPVEHFESADAAIGHVPACTCRLIHDVTKLPWADLQPTFYIGDSVYAKFDGNGIELATLRHSWRLRDSGTNWVYLGPEVFKELIQYAIQVGLLEKGQILK